MRIDLIFEIPKLVNTKYLIKNFHFHFHRSLYKMVFLFFAYKVFRPDWTTHLDNIAHEVGKTYHLNKKLNGFYFSAGRNYISPSPPTSTVFTFRRWAS